ncbi:FAD-dependent oxidoreductase [Agrococcus beijingensis]|uniref:FAD-dependent oxidoreductase n=1 Tax=Agrococcus beijingensis TaxID=3068634 RepID=UPI002741C70E|nr:FAD-dependent oxidoreductase [Agrococcus sp. REN33]
MGERIAVVGAGVIGLSIAHELATAGRRVTVLADLEPLETTSAIAGAVWFPYAAERSAAVDTMLATTLARLTALATHEPDAGIDLRRGLIIERSPDPDRSWTTMLRATEVHASDLPAFGVAAAALGAGATAMSTTAPLATMSLYLPWLRARCAALGVRFERRVVDDVDALAHDFDVVVVAAGARGGALLGDDANVVPVRGQVVRVEHPGVDGFGIDGFGIDGFGIDGLGIDAFVIDDENPAGLTYVLPRRDCVVLGGTHDVGATSLEPDPATEAAIIERCEALVPAVAGQRILSRAVGLRPGRATLRIEEVPRRALRVIAAYGHGGSGMTLSWGTAERVAALLG